MRYAGSLKIIVPGSRLRVSSLETGHNPRPLQRPRRFANGRFSVQRWSAQNSNRCRCCRRLWISHISLVSGPRRSTRKRKIEWSVVYRFPHGSAVWFIVCTNDSPPLSIPVQSHQSCFRMCIRNKKSYKTTPILLSQDKAVDPANWVKKWKRS